MSYRTTLILAGAIALSASSFAQTQRSALGVRIQSTFRAADANKNGTVSSLEAAKAGIPATSFVKYDGNRDRRLSSNEFEGYYRQLMVVRRKEQAKRMAAQKAQTKRRGFQPVAVPSQPVRVITPTKDVLPGKPAGNVAVAGPAKEVATVPAPVQLAPKKVTGETVRKNRDILQAQAVGKRFVKDLQSNGKLGAKDARDMIEVLTLPTPGQTEAATFVEWRAALNNARTRIGALVQSKALTAAEGRTMYLLFEQRAKDAIGWQETGGVTQVTPEAGKRSALKATKVKGRVKGNVKPINGSSADDQAGEKAAAAKLAHDQQRIQDARAKKDAHDKQRIQDARALQHAHEKQRIEDARARLAEQRAKELAAKKAKLGKSESAKKVQIANLKPKAAPKASGAKGVRGTPKPLKRKGSAVNPTAGKPGQNAKKPAGKTPLKEVSKVAPVKTSGK